MSSLEQRRKKRRKVLAGFPWEGSFATKDQVLAYLSGDKIQCLLCGKWYKALGTHINAVHEYDVEKYKLRFGIPWTYGIVCAHTSKLHGDAVRKSPHFDSLTELARIARESLDPHQSNKRGICQAIAVEREQRIGAVLDAEAVSRQCSECSEPVSVHGSRVFVEEVQCRKCILARSGRTREGEMLKAEREKLMQWQKDNAERSTEYYKAKNFWGWKQNPLPLIAYAKKWNARLRIMPQLLEAARLQDAATTATVLTSSLDTNPIHRATND